MEMNAKEGGRMNLIEYIEKESGMNCPEWLRETIERYATWSQTYSNTVEDAVGEVPYAKRTAKTTQNVPNDDLISRKAAIEIANDIRDCITVEGYWAWLERLKRLPSAQPEREDCTELKREFIRMAEYIDVLLKCSDEQKETLIGFITRMAEIMPWTERD